MHFTKPISNMIQFSYTNQWMIGGMYEHMDNMIGKIKDIIGPRYLLLYDYIHYNVVKRWDNMNVPLHVLTPKYYSPSWLAQPTPEGGVERKPHIDPEV